MNINELKKELEENFKEISSNNENEVIDFIIRPILEFSLREKGLKYKPHYVKRSNQSGNKNFNPDFILMKNENYTAMIEAKKLNETFNINSSKALLKFKKNKYTNDDNDVFGQMHRYFLYAKKELKVEIPIGVLTNGKDWLFIKGKDFCDYNNLKYLFNTSKKFPSLYPKNGWKEQIEQISIYKDGKVDKDRLSELINKFLRIFCH